MDRAASLEDEGSIRALNYSAHVSLAVYDAIDPVDLIAAIERLADGPPIALRFNRVSTFNAGRLVLWLAPEPEVRMTALHAAVHAALGRDRSIPYYRPDAWIPHCTLATTIAPRHRDAAFAFAGTPIDPVDIAFDRLDAVAFPPVSILARVTLADQPPSV